MSLIDKIKKWLEFRATMSPVAAASLPLIQKLEMKKLDHKLKEREKRNV